MTEGGNGAWKGPSDPSPPPPTRADVARQPAAVVFVFLVLTYVLVGGIVQYVSIPFGLVFSELVLFAAPALLLAQAVNLSPRTFHRLSPPRPAVLALGFAAGAANLPLGGGLGALLGRLAPRLSEMFDSKQVFEGATLNELAMIGFAVSFAAPIGEELLFRGYLQRIWEARVGTRGGVVIAAVLFAVMHLDPIRIPVYIELGCLFGTLTVLSGSIWTGIAAHCANNLIATLLFLSFRDEAGPADSPVLFPILGGAALTAGVLYLFVQGLGQRGNEQPVEAVNPEQWVHFDFGRIARPAAMLVAASFLAIALFAVSNWRTVQVAGANFRHPVSLSDRVANPDDQRTLARQLRAVRQRATRGDIPLVRYRALLEELAKPGPLSKADAERVIDEFSGATPPLKTKGGSSEPGAEHVIDKVDGVAPPVTPKPVSDDAGH